MISWLSKIDPQLHEIWQGEWGAHTLEPLRYLYDHELVLVLGGGCRVEINGQSFLLKKGNGIIVPSGVRHLTLADTGGVVRFCAHFHWSRDAGSKPPAICCFFPEKPRRSSFTPAPPFVPREVCGLPFSFDAETLAAMEKLRGNWDEGGELARALCRVHLLEILIRLFGGRGTARLKGDSVSRLAYQVKDLMDRDEGTPVQELLPTLGFSYAHLCRHFRAKFGVTPIEYRNAIRLERVHARLQHRGGLSIAEIALQEGFSDAAYLTRLFRKRYGTPPSAMRWD